MIKCHNTSGSMLIMVISVMLFLSIFAFSAGQMTSIQIHSAEKELSRTRANAAALSGVYYAIHLLQRYPNDLDTISVCGIKTGDPSKTQKYLNHVILTEDTYFDVSITDEARRINLNALTLEDPFILARLIEQNGYPLKLGKEIAEQTAVWMYNTKKAPLDDEAELLMLPSMTQEIFAKLKEDITIYPKHLNSVFQVNYWTVSPHLYDALIDDLRLMGKVENVQSVISLVQPLRSSPAADRPDPVGLAVLATAKHVVTSACYRIDVNSTEKTGKTQRHVEAVVCKDQDGKFNIERLKRMP